MNGSDVGSNTVATRSSRSAANVVSPYVYLA